MRHAFLAGSAAVLMMAAACGAYSFPSGASTGTVSGSVMLVPCAPVEQANQPCRKTAGAGFRLTFTADSGTKTAETDSNGHYTIDLSAGTWKVSVQAISRIISGPTTVTVPGGGSVHADYVIDTGIRVPGPPATTN